MGFSSQPFPVSLSLKNQLREANLEDRNSSYGHLWRKALARRGLKQKARSGTPRNVLMKRRTRVIEGSRRRGAMGIKTRIRTLKRLIPNSNSESTGLDELFRESADYILTLQMRVRVMQVMVDVLTGCDE
ncbi:transcription factor UPBEAT1 [Prosopis cineraria]|uniref:transcription factor UPBEAT1 n=1 Tax=Prosopis cineraria TaxID=364024 RepID=UPI00240E9F93|nr:transcription factor UPBEAT1 [Prosopis cineraria]